MSSDPLAAIRDFMAEQVRRLEDAHWDRVNADYLRRVFPRSQGWISVREALERAKAGMPIYPTQEEMDAAREQEQRAAVTGGGDEGGRMKRLLGTAQAAWVAITDKSFRSYVLSPCEESGWREWTRAVWCRLRGHPYGVFWYNPSGLEPDMHCRNCGDDLS